MNIYKNSAHSRGVSIIEALLAAVIVGIGFISVYTLTTTSTRMLYNSAKRDNDTLSTSMIMDDIELDRFSVTDTTYHDAVSSANYNNLDLSAGCNNSPPAALGRKNARQIMRWCNSLVSETGGMGAAGSRGSQNDQRRMFVRDVTITSNGYIQQYKVIGLRIEHYSRNRDQRKYYRKILHE